MAERDNYLLTDRRAEITRMRGLGNRHHDPRYYGYKAQGRQEKMTTQQQATAALPIMWTQPVPQRLVTATLPAQGPQGQMTTQQTAAQAAQQAYANYYNTIMPVYEQSRPFVPPAGVEKITTRQAAMLAMLAMQHAAMAAMQQARANYHNTIMPVYEQSRPFVPPAGVEKMPTQQATVQMDALLAMSAMQQAALAAIQQARAHYDNIIMPMPVFGPPAGAEKMRPAAYSMAQSKSPMAQSKSPMAQSKSPIREGGRPGWWI